MTARERGAWITAAVAGVIAIALGLMLVFRIGQGNTDESRELRCMSLRETADRAMERFLTSTKSYVGSGPNELAEAALKEHSESFDEAEQLGCDWAT